MVGSWAGDSNTVLEETGRGQKHHSNLVSRTNDWMPGHYLKFMQVLPYALRQHSNADSPAHALRPTHATGMFWVAHRPAYYIYATAKECLSFYKCLLLQTGCVAAPQGVVRMQWVLSPHIYADH